MPDAPPPTRDAGGTPFASAPNGSAPCDGGDAACGNGQGHPTHGAGGAATAAAGPTPTPDHAAPATPGMAPGTDAARSFLAHTASSLVDWAVACPTDRAAPVCEALAPDELAAAFAAAGAPPFHLPRDTPPATRAALDAAITATLRFSVRTAHPWYANQLYARPDPAALGAEWAVGAAAAAVHTFEAAPVFTLAETSVLAALADRVGGAYSTSHDGLFLPGGAAANAAALALARVAADPAVRARGAGVEPGRPRLVGFVSSHAHFSFAKAAAAMGLGTDNLVAVPCDGGGAMDPSALRDAMAGAAARGHRPFFVGATAGTTVLGAFDPLPACAAAAREHGAWLHVDGAWGGAFLFSPALRAKWLAGLEAADSWSLSAHKLLGAPPPCAALVTRHAGAMAATYGCSSSSGDRPSTSSANGGSGGGDAAAPQPPPPPTTTPGAAPYLYGAPGTRLHARWDLGDRGPGCGRRADAFKLWLLWAGAGDAGLAARAEAAASLAVHAAAGVSARAPALEAVGPPSGANACFWYVPPALRPLEVDAARAGRLPPGVAGALAAAAPATKAALQARGGPLITFTPRPEGGPPFFRLVFPAAWGVVSEADVDAMLDAVVSAGDEACGGGCVKTV
jgi:glutamate decarboxylase